MFLASTGPVTEAREFRNLTIWQLNGSSSNRDDPRSNLRNMAVGEIEISNGKHCFQITVFTSRQTAIGYVSTNFYASLSAKLIIGTKVPITSQLHWPEFESSPRKFWSIVKSYSSAHNECLDVRYRWRTWWAAKSSGEQPNMFWSGDVRMGKPSQSYVWLYLPEYIGRRYGKRGNWNILVPRGRENNQWFRK